MYKRQENISQQIHDISVISDAFLQTKSLLDFEKLMIEHEKIISSIIQQKPVKSELFPDYFGEIKSLGAWGGDFVMVTGNEETPSYFKNKGIIMKQLLSILL